MANLTGNDIRKLIEESSWKHPYNESGDGFMLVTPKEFADLGIHWTASIKLIDATKDEPQRLEISSSTDRVSEGFRQNAYRLCNKLSNEYSYAQTWFSEEDGKMHISASVEAPGDLPWKWLVDSFMNQNLEILLRFWTESFVVLGELDRFKESQKAKAGAAKESDSASQDEVRKAAEQGDAEAQFKLGKMFRGIDSAEAAKWYRKAAEQGHAKAQCWLGECIFNKDSEEAMREAVKWFLKSAEQGDAEAQYNLGDSYFNGNGVEKDVNKALKWFRKAAEHENEEHGVELLAQTRLGQMYDRGDGVAQDYTEAAKWLRKAAERGFAKAQSSLAILYAEGHGVPKDIAEAVRLFRLAAEQGVDEAQCNLGLFYARGYGVQKDLNEAMKWLRKAADQGNSFAEKLYATCCGNG